MDQSEREEIKVLLQNQGKAFTEFRAANDRRIRNLESVLKEFVKKSTRPSTDVSATGGNH